MHLALTGHPQEDRVDVGHVIAGEHHGALARDVLEPAHLHAVEAREHRWDHGVRKAIEPRVAGTAQHDDRLSPLGRAAVSQIRSMTTSAGRVVVSISRASSALCSGATALPES